MLLSVLVNFTHYIYLSVGLFQRHFYLFKLFLKSPTLWYKNAFKKMFKYKIKDPENINYSAQKYIFVC